MLICDSFEGELMDACLNAYRGMLCPNEEVKICTQKGRWDGVSICCHIRKAVGQAALEILQSSAQAMLEVEVVTLSLTESCKGAPLWVMCLGWCSLHLRGTCAARQIQVHWVTYYVCDWLAGSMQGALSMVGMVSPAVGVHRCCGNNLEDWYKCMV